MCLLNMSCIFLGATADSWNMKVVKPCVDIVRDFLSDDTILASRDGSSVTGSPRMSSRELWTQYVCEVIGRLFLFLPKRMLITVSSFVRFATFFVSGTAINLMKLSCLSCSYFTGL